VNLSCCDAAEGEPGGEFGGEIGSEHTVARVFVGVGVTACDVMSEAVLSLRLATQKRMGRGCSRRVLWRIAD